MKEKLLSRLDKLEEALREENVVPMVAVKIGQDIRWNGVTYPDDASLLEAVTLLCGQNPRKPLVIITIAGRKFSRCCPIAR